MRNKRKSGDRPGSTRTIAGLPIVRAQVAGIDIGSERHWVCAPGLEGSGREVADFGATTAELVRMAEWLKERKVESVAMESTGVYWIAPHEVLEKDFEVLLVDTRQLARVPGRNKKTDPSGVTGMAIVRAIAAGERDARKLAQLRDQRSRKSKEEIAEQLSGHWREDHLFSLRQSLQMYDAIAERITAYEQEILKKLATMEIEE